MSNNTFAINNSTVNIFVETPGYENEVTQEEDATVDLSAQLSGLADVDSALNALQSLSDVPAPATQDAETTQDEPGETVPSPDLLSQLEALSNEESALAEQEDDSFDEEDTTELPENRDDDLIPASELPPGFLAPQQVVAVVDAPTLTVDESLQSALNNLNNL